MSTDLFNPPALAPDLGELDNPAWIEVVNLIPAGQTSWIPLAPLTQKVQLATSDIRGLYVHTQDDGTLGWMIYYGAASKIYEIDPNSWAETDRSGVAYTPSAVHGWRFTGFGANVFAAAGHAQDLLYRPPRQTIAQGWQEDNSGGPSYVDITTALNDDTAADADPFPQDVSTIDAAAAVDKGGGKVGIPATGHGFSAGDGVVIDGTVNYDGSEILDATTTANEMVITAAYVAETFAGTETATRHRGNNDAVYFGFENEVNEIVIVVVAGTTSYTLTWEYWNGSAWTALSGVSDGTSNFTSSGTKRVTFTLPSNWTANAVNGSATLFYVRARRDSGNVLAEALLTKAYGQPVFQTAITHAEPVHSGGAATGNWPPLPRFVANFGDAVAIANIKNTGPAGRGLPSDIDQNLLWVSETDNGLRYGVEDDPNHQGKRTAYFYLDDDHGPISALFGGAEFGMVAKPRAIYGAIYGGPFRVDFPLLTSQIGCSEPHSGIWVDDKLYFWSTAGPAEMSRNGVRVLGEKLIQRALFDDAWIANTYSIKQDTSLRYMLWASYITVPGVVSWWYRGAQDQPIYGVHYQISTGRFSFSEHQTVLISGTGYTGELFGVCANPLPENTRYSGTKDLFFISRDSAGNVVLYESDPDGGVKWRHAGKMTSAFLPELRDDDGNPLQSVVDAIRPRYTVRVGLTAPVLTLTVEGKTKPGATSTSQESVSVEDLDGQYEFGAQREERLKRVVIQFGPEATMLNTENLAEFDGLEVERSRGGSP